MAEKEEKMLSLKAALGGLENFIGQNGQTLFVKTGETEFFVTQRTFIPSTAKACWVEKMLPKWVNTLNEKSGAKVISINLERPFTVKDKSNGNYCFAHPSFCQSDCMGSINIQMVIPGLIDITSFNETMGKAISGAVKKQLALGVLKQFPPPFDAYKPLVLANSLDYLEITGLSIFSKTEEEAVIKGIHQFIAEAGAEVIAVTCKNAFVCYQVTIRWLRDVTDAKRMQLRQNIIALFMRKLKFQPDVYLGVW